MIDLHCHILPGADDGAATLEEACYMAQQAVSDGIRTIVATSHVCNDKHVNHRDEIAKNVVRLNDEFRHAGIELTVILGAEVQLTPKVKGLLLRGDASTINGSRYVLIELPRVFELAAAKDGFLRSV